MTINFLSLIISVPGDAATPYKDRLLQFNAYRCRYPNCKTPAIGPVNVADERPSNATMWSNPVSWTKTPQGWGGNLSNGNYAPPNDGDDVYIPACESSNVVNDLRPRLHDRFILAEENLPCKWPQFADFSSSRDPRRKADMLGFRRGKLVV